MYNNILHIKQYISRTAFFVCLLVLSGCSEYSPEYTTPFFQDVADLDNSILVEVLLDESNQSSVFSSYLNTISVVLYDAGEKISSTYVSGTTLDDSLHTAGSTFPTDIASGKYAIHVFVYEAWKPIDTEYMYGRDGLLVRYGSGVVVYPPSYAIETNRSFEDTKQKMYEEFLDTYAIDCKKVGCSISYATSKHVAKDVTRDVVHEYFRGKIVKDIAPVTIQMLDTMIAAGSQRLVNNVDGKFVYVYNPSSGKYSNNNNMIRQFMGSRILAELAHADTTLEEKHRTNVEYILANWYQEEGEFGYVWYNNKSKLGAIALLLRTLVESPFAAEYTQEIEKLTNTILALQDEQGLFVPWYIEPNYAYDADYLMTFYSGEAILALVEMYEYSKLQRILDAALLAQDAYVDRYVDEIDAWYYPAYVPWHTMSLYKLYKITGNQRYVDAIFVLNDKLLDEMLVFESDILDIVGRFYNPEFPQYGTPHSASDGVYTEGLVYAYMLAYEVGDEERITKYKNALDLAVYNLEQLQYTKDEAYFLQYPERVLGALRFRTDDNRIRIDTTQHAIDGLLVLQQFLENK